MRKILSLTSKDFETGLSTGAEQVKLGLFYTANRLNPFITEGTLRWSQEPVEIGAGTVVGIPQSFAINGEDAYSLDASGNIYKIAQVFGSPTVTKPKSGLTNNAYGLEIFQTLNSNKYLYYFQKAQIGRFDLSSTFTDNWKAISAAYQSDVYPTLRIDDELFFGSKYVVSKVSDNGSSDTELYENQLDLPKDYIITSLSTDGDYLIIAASKSVSTTLDYAETRIYFWDYKNILPSWTRSFTIQDPQIRGMKTVGGITYAVGQYGLYRFTFSSEPERIREDIKCTVGYGNISRLRDSVSFGNSTACATYGKLKPASKTAVFKPYILPADISCLDTFSSNSIGLFGTIDSKIYRQSLFSAPTNYNTTSFLTGKIDLGNQYKVKRVEIVFNSALTTDDTMIIQIQGNNTTAVYSTVAYSTFGAKSVAIAEPTGGEAECDALALSVSACAGTFRIRQIDIYGEQTERTN
jgi:hypothetical protein